MTLPEMASRDVRFAQGGRGGALKRLVVGEKLRSSQAGETLLSKRIALPVFASDPLSSVAYSPDEIFLTLSMAGLAAYAYSWKVGLVIAFVLGVVVLSYRQNVRAYQSGGGDYEVAMTNLGSWAGLTVASALLVDYVLTVAVSISSAAQYAATTISPLEDHKVLVAVLAVGFLTAMNLRGVRESGTAFAVPTYVFMVSMLGMIAWGFIQFLTGDLGQAPSADYGILPEEDFVEGFTGAAAAFLLLRTFASGCATLTGVEAIANGVPAFKKPKGRNAATTLLVLGIVATTMALSIVTLANLTHVRVVEIPEEQLLGPDGKLVDSSYHQDPIVGQLAHTIFDNFPPGFFLVAVATGLILMLAANTAFNGFPVLASVLAKDGYMARQLTTRGDRLAYSNGVLLLAAFSIVLIVAFEAEVTRLIQLYIVGVFVSFTASQTGMVVHWNRLLRASDDPIANGKMRMARLINAVGLTVTGVVLVVVLITKFTRGAWIAILAMAVVYAIMLGIRRHYDAVAEELAVVDDDDQVLPTRVHAIVLVFQLHKPTLRALAYAQALRPNELEAVVVDTDHAAVTRLMEEWDERGIGIPLRIVHSPYRKAVGPVVQHVRAVRKAYPRGVVAVYVPEYVVGHWWERLLHNQGAFRIKTALLFQPGVVITSVPYQLQSSRHVT